jgi:hypothetical protein
MFAGGYSMTNDVYMKLMRVLSRLNPFYQYFFDYYSLNKKVLVLSMLTSLRVYDQKLFSNFTQNLD